MNHQLPPLRPRRTAITEDDILAHFTLTEAFRIVYVPVILAKAAFDYATFARRICAEKRLNFAKPCRVIRQAIDDYDKRYTYLVRTEPLQDLQAKVDNFFDEADNSLQVLWYTIKNQLARQYPEVGNYDLLANIYMAVSILDYVRRHEEASSHEIRRRTGIAHYNMAAPEITILRRALMSIAGAYRMDSTDTLRLAIRALALKADKMVQVVVQPGPVQVGFSRQEVEI